MIFQLSVGTDKKPFVKPRQIKRSHGPREAANSCSVSSCNCWRVHFFSLVLFSTENRQQNIVDYQASGNLFSINMHVCIIQPNLIWYLLHIYYNWKIAAELSSAITYFKKQPQQGEKTHMYNKPSLPSVVSVALITVIHTDIAYFWELCRTQSMLPL